ncbi:unnamed protein product [Phaeothamnion confervicola]
MAHVTLSMVLIASPPLLLLLLLLGASTFTFPSWFLAPSLFHELQPLVNVAGPLAGTSKRAAMTAVGFGRRGASQVAEHPGPCGHDQARQLELSPLRDCAGDHAGVATLSLGCVFTVAAALAAPAASLGIVASHATHGSRRNATGGCGGGFAVGTAGARSCVETIAGALSGRCCADISTGFWVVQGGAFLLCVGFGAAWLLERRRVRALRAATDASRRLALYLSHEVRPLKH